MKTRRKLLMHLPGNGTSRWGWRAIRWRSNYTWKFLQILVNFSINKNLRKWSLIKLLFISSSLVRSLKVSSAMWSLMSYINSAVILLDIDSSELSVPEPHNRPRGNDWRGCYPLVDLFGPLLLLLSARSWMRSPWQLNQPPQPYSSLQASPRSPEALVSFSGRPLNVVRTNEP